jgi:hypothetical protein
MVVDAGGELESRCRSEGIEYKTKRTQAQGIVKAENRPRREFKVPK